MVVEVVVVKAKVGVTSNKRKVAEVVAELVVVELVLVGAKILMVVEVIPVVIVEHLQVENIHRKILAVVVTAVRLVAVARKVLLHQPVQHQYHSDSAVFPALPIILKVDTDCIRLRMII